MSDPLRTIGDYELFLYSLTDLFPSIRQSSLVLARRGATLARVAGEISFDCGFQLVVRERLTFDRLPVVIDSYGYEIWREEEKLCWYDSQPHPNEPILQAARAQPESIRAQRCSSQVQCVSAQILFVGPFDTARDATDTANIPLVFELSKDALVQEWFDVEEPDLAVRESNMELIARS